MALETVVGPPSLLTRSARAPMAAEGPPDLVWSWSVIDRRCEISDTGRAPIVEAPARALGGAGVGSVTQARVNMDTQALHPPLHPAEEADPFLYP